MNKAKRIKLIPILKNRSTSILKEIRLLAFDNNDIQFTMEIPGCTRYSFWSLYL